MFDPYGNYCSKSAGPFFGPRSWLSYSIFLFFNETEKQKEQFALCGERRNELLTVFEKAAFIRGFRLGARMAAEVLSD